MHAAADAPTVGVQFQIRKPTGFVCALIAAALVELWGIEPQASSMRPRRSTN